MVEIAPILLRIMVKNPIKAHSNEWAITKENGE